MGDRVASFTIGVSGDDVDITSFLSGLKTKFTSTVSDIQSLTRKTNLFEGLQQNVADAADALDRAKQDVTTFTAALAAAQGAGKDVTKDLQTSLAAAQKATASATTEYNRQVDAISKLQNTLSRANIDTSNLAAAQQKLAEQAKNATNAVANQVAQQLLGLKTFRDTTPEVQKLYAAYNTLSVSGTLSAKELAVAQGLLTAKVAETKAGVSTLSVASAAAGPNLVSMFVTPLIHALGLTAGIAGVVHVVGEAIQASKDYAQGVAQIGSVTNLTKDQLAGLGRGARDLAQEIGIDLNEALKGLYELIRSGVPPENALQVLKVSAEAAKAAFTDTASGVKAANLLISAFGAGVGDLAGDFDILVQSQGRGGATLKEFADSAGPLLNVARAAGIGLQDLVATLGVMTNASGDAQGSIEGLQRIIVKLGEPGTRSGLRELGIDTSTLVTTFQGIAASGKTVDQILALGVSSTKSAAGVAALTNNTQALGPALEAAGNAAGTTADKLAGLYDTPKERSERFNAALHETAVIFGEAFGSGSRFQELGTLFLTTWNSQTTAIKDFFNPAAAEAKVRLDEMAAASKSAATEAAAHTAKITEQRAELTRLVDDLDKQIKLIQSGAAQDISDLNARADAQIAALDKSAAAELKTAADTIAIRTKLANDTFVLLTSSEAKITAATEAAIAARVKLGREAGQTEADFSAAIAKIRLDGISQTLAGYQTYYKTLQDQENAYLGKVQSVSAARIAFNQDVEQKLTDIRNVGLSSFDQYLATVKRIDELISLERQAAANGDIELAKKYADQAIALSGTIKTATSVNGSQIVSSLDVQTTAIGKIKQAQDVLNSAFDAQGKSAKAGADATRESMDSVSGKIKELQNDYDVFKKAVAEGVKARLTIDEDSLRDTTAKLDAATKDRTVTITVKTVSDDGTPVGLPLSQTGFAHGGPVGRMAKTFNAIRGYAGGGAVFREPTWAKVPGVGDGDTVPARLSIGSFVMRKAASMFYGDDAMNKLAQGFASGGPVNTDILTSLMRAIGNHASLPFDPTQLEALGDASAQTARSSTDAADVIAYAQEVMAKAGNGIEAQGVFGLVFKDIQSRIRYLQEHPTDATAVAELLKSASAMGANLPMIDFYGRSAAPSRIDHFPFSFDDFIAEGAGGGGAVGAFLSRLVGRFAGGGGVDSIPALLTPGEFVLKPSVVRMFGGGLLSAMNALQVPRDFLSNIGNIAAPRPLAFANGGLVPGGPTMSMSSGSGARAGATFNFYTTKLDVDEVRRTVVPELRKIMDEER